MFNQYQYSPYNNSYQDRYSSIGQQVCQPIQNQQFQFKMMPVSNIAEANATPVDTLNGMPSFFYNKATDEIYMKQFNSNSGGAIFQTYKLQVMETPKQDTYEAQFQAINEKIDGLYSILRPKKKAEVTNE